MRVVVVGGGIAGPATAMALQMVNADVVVLEATPAGVADEGSWLTISPNGLAALDELRALDAVRHLGVPTRRTVMVSASGRRLGSVGLGAPLADGTVALSFKRSTLGRALVDEAKHRGIEVRQGVRVASVETVTGGALVHLVDGDSLEADVVVGADGIHSAVRRAVDPTAPDGRYVGLTNFGGVTRNSPLADELAAEAWTMTFGRRAFFGALPTARGDVVWFANVPREQITRDERAGTSDAAWRQWLARLAQDDAGPMAELIRTGELELAGDNTFDLAHVPTWHRGRMVLVGDAVHAPAPSSGQGAALALEDAVVLAAALRDASTPEAAFATYDSVRRPRVERVVRDGARASSSKAPGPVGRAVQAAVMPLIFRHLVTDRSQAWKFDHRVSLATPGDGAHPGGHGTSAST